jgi:hypothetical protein
MGEKRNTYKVLVIKPEGKKPFQIPRHRCKENIQMDLIEVGWEGV